MSSEENQELEIPHHLVENFVGVSIDEGHSQLKLVYVPNDSEDKKAGVKLATFKSSEPDKAIDFIAQHCLLRRQDGEIPVIYATGPDTGARLDKELESRLNVRIAHSNKLECFARGFAFLSKNLEPSKYINPSILDPLAEILNEKKKVDGFNVFNKHPFEYHGAELAELGSQIVAQLQDPARKCVFPCLLVVCGSSCRFLKVYEDGEYELVDEASTGGASFRGIGSLLSASKTSEELDKLTAVGDSSKVHYQLFDIMKNMAKTDDVYHSMVQGLADEIVFCMAKAPGKTTADFQPGDLARAYLDTVTLDLVQLSFTIADYTGLNDVVFCGSFVNSQLVRELMSDSFMKKKVHIFGLVAQGGQINIHFLHHCSHIAALGAMVSGCERRTATKSDEQM